MAATAFLKGLGLGGSLIVAIGSQNAYLLRQALKREFVLTCVAVCVVCDMALIAAGVAGMGQLITGVPALLWWLKLGGAAFLLAYGWRAARSALRPAALVAGDGATVASRGAVVAAMLTFTLLNPHVYLDVILLGSIGGQQAGNGRLYFAAGAMAASLAWFSGLGWGARYLAPVFALPRAWQVLDGVIAVVMWTIAASLLV
ncbi:LysE family transporter [Duganella sp. LX20W]|uniref:LysE family transporter n=1 Tax=Rugamonas brunnea TaxID=2758569 RepID=A0A7W2EQI4_9BURK|nr:LysE family transporter [Rugamonas brunnea]MBA5636665.1 LysE family transporter [Rugamonas brunnea]